MADEKDKLSNTPSEALESTQDDNQGDDTQKAEKMAPEADLSASEGDKSPNMPFIPANTIETKAGSGVIRHRNVSGEKRKFRGVADHFLNRLQTRVHKLMSTGELDGWEENVAGSLTGMKKKLQSLTTDEALKGTKTGIEVDVAIAAILVDFHKQSVKEQRKRTGLLW